MEELFQSDDWLDLTAIAEMTQTAYGVLRRYAEQTDVQRAFGAERQPGAKGVRWPAASLSDWHKLAEGHREGTITPKTVAAYLTKQTALVPLSNSGIVPIQQLGEDAVTLLQQIVETLQRNNPPDDCLLTLKAAHSLTGLPYSVLKPLRVQCGRRLYVRRSDALRVIQELKP